MGISKEERLTSGEQNKIHSIDSWEDLNEIKILENRCLKILDNLGDDTSEYRKNCDRDTLELSDNYYKKIILKTRLKMIEEKGNLHDIQYEYHSKKHKLYKDKLNELESEIFGQEEEPF